MKGSIYTVCYAGILGAVCALLLTAASSFTAPYRASNAEAEEILNILTALNVPFEAGGSAEQLVEVFNNNVRQESRGNMIVYVYSPPHAKSRVEAVATRFSGPGLWGPIKGFLAVEADMKTIRGITFYEQEETPGLGGEIAAPLFRERFKGKSIVDEKGTAGIFIRGGGNRGRNEVDAITGATMTCDKVEAMLNVVIKDLVKEKGSDGQ